MELMIHVNSEEKEQIERFAKSKGKSVSEVFLSAVMEQIEDEFDSREAEEAIAEFNKNPVSYTSEEVVRMLGISI